MRFSGRGAERAAAEAPEPKAAQPGEPVLKPEAGRLLAGLLHGLQTDLRPPVRPLRRSSLQLSAQAQCS